ncbi:hypothetical protein I3843_13G082700 [Carya illinoinensis]|uniref:Large ribosomal subunit protein uL11m n=1 Tax=Carya illinoinensis TaxID=32201 RepID=A0A922AN73_CARIL|nr:50S ribosomal protein L11 isoform X1 [Carya illinoinensis]KAG2673513.1 hypothetical protein I3760_13G094900 [Carya illinoinensis]KAG6681497.1 hypothetical protein I3842_13G095700 [Carya illinoinensis]KAG7949825.1 hypothetical protein I3843_13G082700 [Carya illinoinensis]
MSTLKEILTRRPVAATIRLTVPAGGARPAPPVGPALGQYRLNLMAFCKDFNARTQKYKPDTPMAVTITAFKDNTFEFIVKSPSVTWYIKKAAGVESGSSRPGHEVASTITLQHVYEIAKISDSVAVHECVVNIEQAIWSCIFLSSLLNLVDFQFLKTCECTAI